MAKAIFQDAVDLEKIRSMLIEVVTNKELPASFRIAAGHEYLDRGYGKAALPVKVQESIGERYYWDRVPIEQSAPWPTSFDWRSAPAW